MTERSQPLEQSSRVLDEVQTDFPRIDPELTLADARVRLEHTGAKRLIVAHDDTIYGLVSSHDLDAALAEGIAADERLWTIVRRPNLCDAESDAVSEADRISAAGATSALVLEGGEPVGVFAPADSARHHEPARPEPSFSSASRESDSPAPLQDLLTSKPILRPRGDDPTRS